MVIVLPLAVAGLVVWAYLRQPPRVRRVVSSVVLLRRLAGGPPRRRRRVTDPLSLALTLAALAAVAVALSRRPQESAPVRVVWDNSAWVSAAHRVQALAALEAHLRAAPGAPVTVIGVSPPRVWLRESRDHGAVRQVVRSAPVPAVALELDRLHALEGRLCEEQGGETLLISDTLSARGWACPVRRPDLGPAGPNAGLVALAARQADAHGLVEVQIDLASTDPGPVELSLRLDGQEVERVRGEGSLWLQRAWPGARRLEAALVHGGAREADDVLQIALPESLQVRALLVTDQPEGYLATALRLHRGVALEVRGPGDALPTEPIDLVVAEVPVGELPPARRTLRWAAGEGPLRAVGALSVSREADPLLRQVGVEGLVVQRARAVAAGPQDTVLWSSALGPLLVRHPRAGGSELRLGVAAGDTDWPLRASFLQFMSNLVEEARPAAREGSVRHGVPASVITSRPSRGASWPLGPGRGPLTWALAGLALLFVEGVRWAWRRG